MKKIFYAIVMCLLSAIMAFGLIACGEDTSWEGTSIKNWGTASIEKGGFVAETENNVYFINGIGTTTDDNTFGVPVQGALMGITKADLKAGKLDKAEIVVPKLFTSSDYGAGLYIYGDYVYYGTPNTEKDSSGQIASGEMYILKTKLDGTDTQKVVKLPSNNVEFRVLNKGGVISVVYYDSTDTSLKVFSNGETKTIIERDDTTNENLFGNGYESLKEYSFINNAGAEDVAIVFTTDVYSEKYYEDKAEMAGYSRETLSYNNIYTYKAGDEKATLVVDGSVELKQATLAYKTGDYIFYKQTDINSNEELFGVKAKEFTASNVGQKLNASASDYLADENLIIDFENVYTLELVASEEEDTAGTIEGGDVIFTTLIGDESAVKRKVALSDTARDILFVQNGYIYFVNQAGQIARTLLGSEDGVEERVSTDVATVSWYIPQIMNIDGEDYLFYCDGSALGCSYLRVVNLSTATVTAEDTDDDGENDFFYLEGNEFLAIKTNAHKAVEFTATLNTVTDENGLIKLEEVNGELVCKEFEEAEDIFATLTDEIKEEIADEDETKYKNIAKAYALAKAYNKLSDIKLVEDTATLEADYNSAKTLKNEIINSEDYSLETILGYIPENLKYFFQEAEKIFED